MIGAGRLSLIMIGVGRLSLIMIGAMRSGTAERRSSGEEKNYFDVFFLGLAVALMEGHIVGTFVGTVSMEGLLVGMVSYFDGPSLSS